MNKEISIGNNATLDKFFEKINKDNPVSHKKFENSDIKKIELLINLLFYNFGFNVIETNKNTKTFSFNTSKCKLPISKEGTNWVIREQGDEEK